MPRGSMNELLDLMFEFSFTNPEAQEIVKAWRECMTRYLEGQWHIPRRRADLTKLKQMIAAFHAKMEELGLDPRRDYDDPESDDEALPGVAEATLPGVAEATLPGVAEAPLPGVAEAQLPGVADATLSGVAEATLPGVAEATLPGVADATLSGVADAPLP